MIADLCFYMYDLLFSHLLAVVAVILFVIPFSFLGIGFSCIFEKSLATLSF